MTDDAIYAIVDLLNADSLFCGITSSLVAQLLNYAINPLPVSGGCPRKSSCKSELPSRAGFSNVQANYYWSSSTYASDTTQAWVVFMGSGSVDVNFEGFNNYVWPVRGGQ